MKTVLILSHRRGFEADFVIDKLRAAHVPVFRFNADHGVDASHLTACFDADGLALRLRCDGLSLDAQEIGVGWCQQLPPYLGRATDAATSLQTESLFAAYRAISFYLSNRPWLNHPRSVLEASNKGIQLAAARECGLAIPDTLISSEPEMIRRFAAGGTIVAKNLATPWTHEDGHDLAALTKIVPDEWLVDGEELSFAPVIYQRFHQRRCDIRVTMVGEQSFAVAGEPGHGQEADIRASGSTGASYHPIDFDPEIGVKLQQLMRRFNLQYCAADFMEDTLGNIRFLELNTCGAWWWVDELYDGAVLSALTSFLRSRVV